MENHHRPYAAFFKKDFSIRPVGEVWKNLTQKTWSTKVKKYLKKGDLSFRGFKGKYLIQADYKGKSKTWEIDLKDDTSLDLTW
jgi:hypothetical protein